MVQVHGVSYHPSLVQEHGVSNVSSLVQEHGFVVNITFLVCCRYMGKLPSQSGAAAWRKLKNNKKLSHSQF